MKTNNITEILQLIQIGDNRLQNQKLIHTIEEYFVNSINQLNCYQKCLAAYLLSHHRHHKVLSTILPSIKEDFLKLKQADEVQEEASVMLSYAQLIHQPIKNP
jgi:hypothetical protein